MMAEGPPRWRCEQCLGAGQIWQDRRNCRTMGELPVTGTPPEWNLYTCPQNYVTPWAEYMVMLYASYREGSLAVAGGIADQPSKYIKAMTILHGLFQEHERDMLERAKRG